MHDDLSNEVLGNDKSKNELRASSKRTRVPRFYSIFVGDDGLERAAVRHVFYADESRHASRAGPFSVADAARSDYAGNRNPARGLHVIGVICGEGGEGGNRGTESGGVRLRRKRQDQETGQRRGDRLRVPVGAGGRFVGGGFSGIRWPRFGRLCGAEIWGDLGVWIFGGGISGRVAAARVSAIHAGARSRILVGGVDFVGVVRVRALG